MPMREGCKHYESRTYGHGETVRQCRLDLAPEAPWRCPADCSRFEPRLADAGWQRGSLAPVGPPPEPPRLDADVIALLDQAEDIVNTAGPGVVADVEEERRQRKAAEAKRPSAQVSGLLARLKRKIPKPPGR